MVNKIPLLYYFDICDFLSDYYLLLIVTRKHTALQSGKEDNVVSGCSVQNTQRNNYYVSIIDKLGHFGREQKGPKKYLEEVRKLFLGQVQCAILAAENFQR